MSNLRIGKKRGDTYQIVLGNKDLIWNSIKDVLFLGYMSILTPTSLHTISSIIRAWVRVTGIPKTIRLNAWNILSNLQKGHICPKFSNENMIDGSFMHVKVILPLLGLNMTSKIQTMIPKFVEINGFFRSNGEGEGNSTNRRQIWDLNNMKEDEYF